MKSKYFSAEELISPIILKERGASAWNLMQDKFIITLDTLKERTGYHMVINTWSFSAEFKSKFGDFSERGLRAIQAGVGSTTGAHYKGLASDIDFYDKDWKRVLPQTMIDYIVADRKYYPEIVGLEGGVNWNHIDCMNFQDSPKRNIPKGKIMIFYADGRSPLIV